MDFNLARRARLSKENWIEHTLNDRGPYKFRGALPADATFWVDFEYESRFGSNPAGERERAVVDVLYAAVHPEQFEQFRLDCRSDDPAYGIDLLTAQEVYQALQGAWNGRPTVPSSPSSTTPSVTAQG